MKDKKLMNEVYGEQGINAIRRLSQIPPDGAGFNPPDTAHIIATCDRLKEALLACYELDQKETIIQVEKKKARCELNVRREELSAIRFN